MSNICVMVLRNYSVNHTLTLTRPLGSEVTEADNQFTLRKADSILFLCQRMYEHGIFVLNIILYYIFVAVVFKIDTSEIIS